MGQKRIREPFFQFNVERSMLVCSMFPFNFLCWSLVRVGCTIPPWPAGRKRLCKMRHSSSKSPRCIVIAGPNGAGKDDLCAANSCQRMRGLIHFVNADLIAGGLSPLRPEAGHALAAGSRLFLAELDRLARARVDFCF